MNKLNGIKKHIPFYIIEAILLILSIAALIVVSKATNIKKVDIDKGSIEVNDVSETEDKGGSLFDIKNGTSKKNSALSEEEKDALYKELFERYDSTFNLAFFGVDSRDGELGAGTRSDSIMICSIDMNTHEVKLISVFRDTYLNIGNDTYNKCNAAYAKGGPERALSMLNLNTDMYMTDYVTIGFDGLIRAIDALGGVTVNVEEDEIFHLNNYQATMADELGLGEYTPVVYAGYQSLNGLQATAYCRIRYTIGDDFKRAERQRTVVSAMIEKAKQVKPGALTSMISTLLPSIQTSLDVKDVLKMAPLVTDFEVTVSDGFPFENMRNGGSMGRGVGAFVVPSDLTANVKKLHKVLFDEDDYEPSLAVKDYSERIKSDTEQYLLY